MAWPLASHFSVMLQNPQLAFRDPVLQQCVVQKNAQGQPRPWAGAFAVVYKATDVYGQNPFAVRVFTTESPERRERYNQISAYLKARRLTCLCDFEYRDSAIRSASDGKWYPLILMEWVQGDTLFQWVQARCLEGNSAALAHAAEKWLAVAKELSDASVAHGDLQHANVMVDEQGQLKLVDYDCLCVPALVGRRNLEVGVQPYQHPARNENTLLALDLDHFSELVIYTALRSLAADPGLWQKHVMVAGYDKLLFRSDDICNPASSALYHDLHNLRDAEVQQLVDRMCDLVHMRMDQIPPLSHLAGSYAKVEQLLKEGYWDAAVKLLNRRGHFRDAPESLKPLIHQAYEHVCRQQAWKAFQRIPHETSEQCDRRIVDAWNEQLFAGLAAAEQERVRVAEARRRVTAVDRICHLAQQMGGQMTVAGEQALTEAASRLPQGYRYSLAPRVDQARRRTQAGQRLEQAIANPRSEAAILAAGRSLIEVGGEQIIPGEQRERIALAKLRAPLLRELGQIPAELPHDEHDARLLDLWRKGRLDDCPEAQPWRAKVKAARRRVELLREIAQAAERGDAEAVQLAAADAVFATDSFPKSWREQIDAARQRVERLPHLEDALRDGQPRKFFEYFDAPLIRRLPDRFGPYQKLLREWTIQEVLPPKRMGLRRVAGWGGITAEDQTARAFLLRWNWPDSRFIDRCLLTLSPGEPAAGDDPDTMATFHTAIVERDRYAADGDRVRLPVQAEWLGAHVAVWALIDLGFEVIQGPPISIGRLRMTSKWGLGKWSIFAGRGSETAQSQGQEQGEKKDAARGDS
ncbi:MAG: hypothetical protein RBS80_02570 [Thermoguttaceae bacterium]|jgi:serine/threonine protein kinase|nr:hypothetical protein [Thermoguttaceae bacterium]